MMNDFFEVFCPTPEQIEESRKRYYKIHCELAVKRSCVTCKHCVHVRNYPGFVTGEECECDIGLECDTILGSVTNCEKWEDGWDETGIDRR